MWGNKEGGFIIKMNDDVMNKINDIQNNGKLVFLCPECIHNDVCALKEHGGNRCEHFSEKSNYKKYYSIHSMFQPIFDWLGFHYPSTDAIFIVEKRKAQLHIPYDICEFEKKFHESCRCENKIEEEPKEDNKK